MVPFMIPLSYKSGIIKNTTNQPLKQAHPAPYPPHNIAYAFDIGIQGLWSYESAFFLFATHPSHSFILILKALFFGCFFYGFYFILS